MDTLRLQQMNNLRSRQLNPCDDLFWKSRGYPQRPYNWKELYEEMNQCYSESEAQDYDENNSDYSEDDEYEYYSDEYEDEEDDEYEDEEDDEEESADYCYERALRSNQNNPNNDEYWRLRGFPGRPVDWKERITGYRG